jgi:SAM-dependent methyltransferase
MAKTHSDQQPKYAGLPGQGSTGYDASLADEFISSIDHRPSREIVLKPTVRSYLETIGVNGKDALDLACGNGDFTRLLSEMGARRVLGVDASAELLADAAKRAGRGIDYHRADLAVAQSFGKFDLAVGIFYLHYARSIAELTTMIGNVSTNLRPGAFFLAAINNPFSPLRESPRFDRAIVPVNPHKSLEEGDALRVIKMRGGAMQTEIIIHYYPPHRYEQLLNEAGFHEIEWLPLRADSALIPAGEEGRWRDYCEENEPAIFRCRLTFE